ncbi:MAG: ester cyclase [Myxococcota bacterium]
MNDTDRNALHRTVIRRLFEEYLSRGDDILDAIVAPEFVNTFTGIGGPAGLASARAFLTRTFADLEITLDAVVADGDLVAARWHLRGEQVGPFRGTPPQPGRVEVSQLSMYRMVDGRIAQSWVEAGAPRPVTSP